MRILFYLTAIISTHQILTNSFRFCTKVSSFLRRGKKNLVFFATTEEVSKKMSKNKAKTEVIEVNYNVTRASGFILEGYSCLHV
jgi:hypothetical protein